MISFTNKIKRIWRIIPANYKRKATLFFLSSLLLLLLDIFSVFLLIPLIFSLLDVNSTISFLSFDFIDEYKAMFALIVVLFFISKNYISILLNKKQARTAFKLSSEYSLLISQHYLLGNYLTFKNQKKSSIIKEVIFIANDFVSNVLLSLNSILSELILLIIITLIGIFYYPFATSVLVFFLGIVSIGVRLYNRESLLKINKIRSNDYDENLRNLNNLLNGYLSIKSNELISQFLTKFKNSNNQLNKNYAILHAKRVNVNKQTEILMVIILSGIFSYIHYFPFEEFNIILFLSVFSALLFKAIPSINKLNISFTNFNSHLFSLDILESKIRALKKTESEEVIINFENQIILKMIDFSFKESKPLFKDFNLTITKGSFIAIVGKSGIGKTTLLNIIAKLINPKSGYIYVDDLKINDSNKYSYFNLITYLTQKPFIYEGTILENIVLTKKEYDVKYIHKILEELGILEVIEQLPNHLETYIGSGGSIFSGGQMQLICIARALINNPQILILDEATNNLDISSKEKVLRYIQKHSKKHNITTILISHDIQSTKDLYTSIIDLEEHEV